MQANLLIAVALTTVALCSAADPECKYRRIRSLALHWANPTDCTRYFRCTTKNVMREIACAEGKVYNAKTGRCATNEQGLCKLTLLAPLIEPLNPCDDEVSGAYLPQHGYCRNFYICNDNKAYPQACEPGSIFNATAGNCQPDVGSACWQNKCINQTDGTYLSDPTSCNAFLVCANGEATAQKCGNGSYFNSFFSICEPDATGQYCWENLCFQRSDGDFVRDTNDCYSYYVCASGSSIKQTCPNGSYFNAFENSCVPGVCTTETTTKPGEDTTTDCTQETTTQCPEVTTDCSCPGGYTNGETAPIPDCCDKYYVCADGQLQVRECGQDYRYDCSLGVCVPDTEHTCWTTECPPVTTTNSNLGSSEYPQDTTPADCNCPGGYKEGELLPLPDYPQNCNKYYICIDGRLEERECGNGNRFDGSLGACVPDTDNSCNPTVNTECTEASTPQTVTDCTCPGGYTNGELIPFPSFPQNCDKYYICVDGTLQERECGNGNLFDSKLGACVPDTEHICWPTAGTEAPPPTSTLCTCPGGYTNGELLPLPDYPENCNKYYICIDGRLEERECGNGNRFDGSLGACVPDTDNRCNPTVNTQCTEVSTPQTVTDCTCPGGYTNGELIPFPNFPQNCDKYYVCVDGTLQERECGNGNLFDSKLGACVPDTEHICWPTAGTEAPPPTSTLCTCPGGYTNGELLPLPDYPENCNKYYICIDGRLEERECGNGNRFDGSLGACVPDTDNRCNPTVNTQCTEVSTPQTVTDCTCPGGYTNGELIPFPNFPQNCDKYYVCVDGTLQERECGNGNLFDSKLGACVPDTEHICWPTAGTEAPPPTSTLCTCPGGYTDGELLPFPNYPENCNKYYVCSNGRLEERECGIGNRFDSSLGVCVPDTNNVCWPNVCKGQPDGTTIPDSVNCTSFYLCEGGIGNIYECPADKWFDPVYKVCMPDYNATCINPCQDTTGILFLPNPDCSKYFLCNNGQPFIETCPSGGFDVNLGKCHADAVCEATLCVGKEDGTTFPVVGNETMFYLCLGGETQIDECTPGHVYNAAIGVCFEQPSTNCDQSKCNTSPPEDGAFAPLTNADDTAFCLCRNGGAFLHHCTDNYTFRADLGICYSNAPCDPEICDVYPENTRSENRNDTHSFCLCVSKVQVIVECPNNQTYNPATRLCQSPDEKCSPTLCLSSPDYTIYPALNNNTSGFCMCLNSDPIYKPCESGTQFNVEKKICLSTSTDVCSNSLCVGNNGLIVGISGDPQSFCYCTSDGIAIKRSCPNSEIFNETLMICQAVGCDGQVCLTHPNEAFPADNEPYSFCICSSTEPSSVTKYNCQNGTRFDPYYLICKQDPCDKSICADLSNEGRIYGANNNPQDFCICTNSIPVLHNCPTGSLFNSTAGICVSATNSQCDLLPCANASLESTYAVPAKNDPYGFCYCFSPTVVEFHSCPSEALFDPLRGICDVADMPEIPGDTCTCPGGYAEGQILPNPTNCRLYYICCNGNLKEFDCGAGNFFDKVTLTCQPLGRSVANVNTQLVRSVPISEDNKLCVENEKHAVPSNCSQYEICLDSIWTRLSCPNAWYYNAEQHRCMEPLDDTVCAYARIKNLPLCLNTMEERTLPAKAENCTQYYRCRHGKWQLETCPAKHFYTKRFNACIPSLDSNLCAARNVTEMNADITHNMNVTSSMQCQHMAVRPHPHNCAMYLMCLEGRWWHQYCTPGMYFNSTFNYCMPNTNVECALASNVAYEESSTHRPHYINCTENERREFPLNCKAYQICIGGVWQRANCNPFWYFDYLLQMCVPNDGSCADNGLRQVCRADNTRPHPLSEHCTQFYYCVNESWATVDCLKGHFYEKELGACVPHADNDKCQPKHSNSGMLQKIDLNQSALCSGRADGVAVPHPDNCLHFFVCIAELATNEQKCVKGSYFDAELGYCRPNVGKCVVPLRGVCANATDGAYVPHPDDCRAYYQCSILNDNELVYCAEGYYYENSTNECRIDNGECRPKVSPIGKCIGPTEHGKLLPHERYCNIYFACVRGLAIPVACPAEHRFNPDVGHCVYNAKLECENGTLSAAINSTTTIYSCANFSDGTHLPIITDCAKYLVCLAGLELLKSCPNDTYFDAEQRLCLPDDGSCPYVVKSEHLLALDPNICEGKHGTLLANLNNCNEFYVCINGRLHQERCYANQYFDQTKNQCLAYKFERGALNVTEIDLEKVQETKIILNRQCTDKPINYTQLCTRIPEGVLAAEQGDCRRYISCNELGEPISQRCRNGESFDSLLGVCRQNDGTCLLENGQRVGECNGLHGVLIRDVDNCRGYFVCINGQKISRECGEHELFDKNLSACQEDVNNVCGASTALSTKLQIVSCIGLNNSTLYPYTPDNCRSYFQCINGTSIVHECADGLYFNATLASCVKDIRECSMPAVTVKRVPELAHLKVNICENAIIGQRYVNISDNCHSFYTCGEDGNIKSTNCPTDELYNSESGACESSEKFVCLKQAI